MRAGSFDSVATDMTSLHTALAALLPEGAISPALDPNAAPLCLRKSGRWPFLFGHFGAEYRPILVEAGWSVACTLIEDPVRRALHLYAVFSTHSPHTGDDNLRPSVLARELSLSQFIRSPEVKPHLSNAQTRFLAGDLGRTPSRTAKELLETFSCVSPVGGSRPSATIVIVPVFSATRFSISPKPMPKGLRSTNRPRLTRILLYVLMQPHR